MGFGENAESCRRQHIREKGLRGFPFLFGVDLESTSTPTSESAQGRTAYRQKESSLLKAYCFLAKMAPFLSNSY